jgi:NAD(P)-dependent dehydrogenase (short-subunit alcohol dehydrogenase family)
VGLLEGKAVLVSGGTQGLGAGIAEAALREGADVAVTGRRHDVGEACVARLARPGRQIHFVPCDVFDQHVAVNTRGPFFLMQGVVADMLRREESGTVLNVITMSAHGGQPYLAPYATSKAALVGLTKNAAHAHRWDRIRINGLNIGWTETEGEDAVQRAFHGAGDDWLEKAAAEQPMGKLGQVDEIADFAVFLLSDRSGVVTGSVIDRDQNVPGAYD